MDLQDIGKLLALMGVSIALFGAVVWLFGRAGFGTVPGTVRLQGQGWGCLVPVGLSIVLSLLLTVVLNLALRFFNR